MKKIILGSFYGHELSIKVPKKEAEIDWNQKWNEWLDWQMQSAVEEYKSHQFMQSIDVRLVRSRLYPELKKRRSLFNRLIRKIK